MFNIKEITKKCRDMYPIETLRLLKAYGPWFMVWGPEKFFHIGRTETPLDPKQPYKIGRGLKFWVNGATFKGWVYMTCNGSDLYDVYFVSELNGFELTKKLGDLYAQDVFEPMNMVIENVPMK